MAYPFKRIGIIGKYNSDNIESTLKTLLAILDALDIPYILDLATMPENYQSHMTAKNIADWPDDINLCIVIGGDGTFLHAGRQMHLKNTPLLGINEGRLGFLADVSSQDLQISLGEILKGKFIIEERKVLQVNVLQNKKIIKKFYAINDAVIHKRTMARMVELDAYINGQFLCHYRADGLIIATATGSTAYALSAGGPIVEPNMKILIIAPICPHTLNYRPMIVGENSHITVTFGDDQQNIQLTVDGQEELILNPENTIEFMDTTPLMVVHPENYQFPQRLREKLNWGISSERQQ